LEGLCDEDAGTKDCVAICEVPERVMASLESNLWSIAAKGGRARALSHHAERRVRENFRALEAVDALRNSHARQR
jgi:hypothetical protein